MRYRNAGGKWVNVRTPYHVITDFLPTPEPELNGLRISEDMITYAKTLGIESVREYLLRVLRSENVLMTKSRSVLKIYTVKATFILQRPTLERWYNGLGIQPSIFGK